MADGSLEDWLDRIAPVLGVPRELVDTALVLDVARVAAHGVLRPAAPLTTFLLGYALARSDDGDRSELDRLAALVIEEIEG